MATTKTRSQIRDAAKARADMDSAGGTSNVAFITDPVWNDWINAEAFELYDLLVAADEDYYASKSDISTDGTNDEFALASDFYKAISVDVKVNGSEWVPLRRFSLREAGPRTEVAGARGEELRYRLTPTKIAFRDRPASGETIRVHYVPRFTTLDTDGATFEGFSGWEEYIVLGCAIRAKQKEESDASEMMVERERLKKRIEAMAANRDTGEPATVVDVLGAIDEFS